MLEINENSGKEIDPRLGFSLAKGKGKDEDDAGEQGGKTRRTWTMTSMTMRMILRKTTTKKR